MVQTVTGNLVEVSSAERIEIFNGVKLLKNYLITNVCMYGEIYKIYEFFSKYK